MAATKNLPPMARPWAKATRKVGDQDLVRARGFFGVDLLPIPSNFFGPDGPGDKRGLARDMRPMRLLAAVGLDHPSALQKATTHMFHVFHIGTEHRNNNAVHMDTQTLQDVCMSAGLTAAESDKLINERIADKLVKDALKKSTADAIGLGAFGAPFFVVDEGRADGERQVYFGSDRFEQMCWFHDWPWVGPDPERPSTKL